MVPSFKIPEKYTKNTFKKALEIGLFHFKSVVKT